MIKKCTNTAESHFRLHRIEHVAVRVKNVALRHGSTATVCLQTGQ